MVGSKEVDAIEMESGDGEDRRAGVETGNDQYASIPHDESNCCNSHIYANNKKEKKRI